MGKEVKIRMTDGKDVRIRMTDGKMCEDKETDGKRKGCFLYIRELV
jgi:hypothetical protein